MNSLELVGGIAFLLWFFTHLWPTLIVDWGRQSLFEARDELFIMAAKQEVFSFDDEWYQAMRNEINTLIRFAEDLTWQRVLFGVWVVKKHGLISMPKDALLIQRIMGIDDAKLRNNLFERAKRIYAMAMGIFILRSPCMMIIMMLAPLVILFMFVTSKGIGRYFDVEYQFHQLLTLLSHSMMGVKPVP